MPLLLLKAGKCVVLIVIYRSKVVIPALMVLYSHRFHMVYVKTITNSTGGDVSFVSFSLCSLGPASINFNIMGILLILIQFIIPVSAAPLCVNSSSSIYLYWPRFTSESPGSIFPDILPAPCLYFAMRDS